MKQARRFASVVLALAVMLVGLLVQPQPAAAQQAIVCRLTVDFPHHSTTVPGTVNVHGRVQCTGRTRSISIVVSLFRDGVLAGTSGVRTGPGASNISANAAAPCVNGSYQGRAGAVIAYPPGGVPSEETLLVNSIPVPLICR